MKTYLVYVGQDSWEVEADHVLINGATIEFHSYGALSAAFPSAMTYFMLMDAPEVDDIAEQLIPEPAQLCQCDKCANNRKAIAKLWADVTGKHQGFGGWK